MKPFLLALAGSAVLLSTAASAASFYDFEDQTIGLTFQVNSTLFEDLVGTIAGSSGDTGKALFISIAPTLYKRLTTIGYRVRDIRTGTSFALDIYSSHDGHLNGIIGGSFVGGVVTEVFGGEGGVGDQFRIYSAGAYLDNLTITTNETVVPEPATWASMMAGLATVGLAARRR